MTGRGLSRRRSLFPAALAVVAFALLALTASDSAQPEGPGALSTVPSRAATTGTAATGLVEAELIEVIDGDTVRVRLNGQEELVRLVGIDSPEAGGPYRDPECYGKEATDLLRELVPIGRTVQLERDQSDRDRFGRLLRYVWLLGARGEPIMLNKVLIAEGTARARSYSPDTKYQTMLKEAEATAISREAGRWDECARGRGG